MTVLCGGHHTAHLLSSLKKKTISGWLWSRNTSRSSEGVGSLMLGAWLSSHILGDQVWRGIPVGETGGDPGRGCRRGREYGRGPRHRCDGVGAGRKETTRAGKLEGFRGRDEPPPQFQQRKSRPGSGRPPPLPSASLAPPPSKVPPSFLSARFPWKPSRVPRFSPL